VFCGDSDVSIVLHAKYLCTFAEKGDFFCYAEKGDFFCYAEKGDFFCYGPIGFLHLLDVLQKCVTEILHVFIFIFTTGLV